MRLFSISKRFKQSLALVGTVWICSSTNEPEASYYKLVFTNRDQVEGWIKFENEKEEQYVFLAAYIKSKNILHVKKQEEIFMAVLEENSFTALIDDQKMTFKKQKSTAL